MHKPRDVKGHLLAGTFKPESGKYKKKRLFTAATSSGKTAFRDVYCNGQLLTALLEDVMPGKGAAQVHAKMSQIDADI